jgi:hypothetical protein
VQVVVVNLDVRSTSVACECIHSVSFCASLDLEDGQEKNHVTIPILRGYCTGMVEWRKRS